ncbi:DUF2510 domain-containing protein [Streptomyces sp. NPDC096198]|uniref:DUF2510 domain-containing protein n=1 Tax=Streptomyces sp. NPDC096198 TaxID=3366080 RepID=UPI0038047B7C
MTQATPPGWYPDPGQTSDGPATERWWDGGAWTDRTRPADPTAVWGSPAQPPGADGQPGGPFGGPFGAVPYPPVPPAPARRGLRTGLAVAVTVAVLVGIGGGVYALTAHDGGGGSAQSRGPGSGGGFGGQGGQGGRGGQGGQGSGGGQGHPFGGQGGQGGGPFGDQGGQGGQGGQGDGGGQGDPFGGQGGSGGPDGGLPGTEDGFATDPFNGISIPVPDGWSGGITDGGAAIQSKHQYKCPGDTSKTCNSGGAYSASAKAQGLTATTARAAAEQDIAKNAEESYGGSSYGGITSHQVLAAKAVTVAGQQGYLVRWKAVTGKGADGCVESLVFPSPGRSGQLVVVRFGIDMGSGGPKPSVLDQVAQGIKAASAGGSGQTV